MVCVLSLFAGLGALQTWCAVINLDTFTDVLCDCQTWCAVSNRQAFIDVLCYLLLCCAAVRCAVQLRAAETTG